MSEPKWELTPAALYELFERHSQCVLDQSGKCPLLVFTQQMCWEINEFFNGELKFLVSYSCWQISSSTTSIFSF
jgi:hypothetical protein